MNGALLKSPEEIVMMREGGKRLARILFELKKIIQTKKTNGIELEKKAEELAAKYSGKPSFKGYRGYPASLCVSLNSEVVHGIPREEIFKEGDLVKLDFGFWYKGFCTDSAVTCPVGEIFREDDRLIRVTQEALMSGIKALKVGQPLGEYSATVQSKVEANGFSVVRDLVGHGVGRLVHEAPAIPNFGAAGSGPKLEIGMTLALEPMVNLGGFEVKFERNGWGVKTADGLNSAHFEHTVAVTEEGVNILTKE